MNYLVITDEGRVFAFNPSDYRYVVNRKDLDEGKYEPRIESKRDGDKIKIRVSQLVPPLVKIQ